MAKVSFTNKAVNDLNDIWDYTLQNWSESQADKYYQDLVVTSNNLANNPEIGRHYSGVVKSVLGKKMNRHIFFYRVINSNEIEIARILHERMDLKNRLEE